MKKAVFLDRDGTITKGEKTICPEKVELYSFSAKAISSLKAAGFKVIVVSNQAKIARGWCPEKTVRKTNRLMLSELSAKGARVDALYYCPHDKKGTVKKYVKKCDCRKPAIGMLEKARKRFGIDYSKSFVVGDDSRDIKMGKNAGCKTILVQTGHAGKDGHYKIKADFTAKNLLEAAGIIARENGEKKEKIFFKNSKGDKLCGILSDSGKGKAALAVLCHGLSSGKDRPKFTGLESALNAKGIATFRFDFFGHGESGGKFAELTLSEAVDDVKKAIALVKRHGYKKIALLGSSFGGSAAILAAPKIKNLSALVLIAPVSNYYEKKIEDTPKKELEEWRKKGYQHYAKSDGTKLRLNYSFFKDLKKNNGYKAEKRIKIPTIIIHGDKDSVVPLKQSMKAARLMKNCSLAIIKGADHKFSKPEHHRKIIALSSEFLAKNINA